MAPRALSNPSRRSPARFIAPAAVAAALFLTACPDEGTGEADQEDPRQTVPPQSPALDQGGATTGEDGVGPSGGPAGGIGR